MSLEAALAANTEAVNKLIGLLSSGVTMSGASAAAAAATPAEAADKPRGPGRPKKDEAKTEPKAASITFDEVKAALFKVRDSKGAPAAQEIIKATGSAAKMADIKPEKYAAIIAACEVALAPAAEEPAASDDDL